MGKVTGDRTGSLASQITWIVIFAIGVLISLFSILLFYISDMSLETVISPVVVFIMGVFIASSGLWYYKPSKVAERELKQKMKAEAEHLAQLAAEEERVKREAEWRAGLDIFIPENSISIWGYIIWLVVGLGLFGLAVLSFFAEMVGLAIFFGLLGVGVMLVESWAQDLQGKNVTPLELAGFKIIKTLLNMSPTLCVIGIIWAIISWVSGLSVQTLLVIIVFLLIYIIWKRGI